MKIMFTYRKFSGVACTVVVLIAALSLAACSGSDASNGEPGKKLLVKFERSGGFDGVDNKLRIWVDGRAIFKSRRSGEDSGESFKVGAGKLRQLKKALVGAGFPSLKDSYLPDNPGADTFQYTVTYRGKRIFMDQLAVPKTLTKVIALLNEIVASRYPL